MPIMNYAWLVMECINILLELFEMFLLMELWWLGVCYVGLANLYAHAKQIEENKQIGSESWWRCWI